MFEDEIEAAAAAAAAAAVVAAALEGWPVAQSSVVSGVLVTIC